MDIPKPPLLNPNVLWEFRFLTKSLTPSLIMIIKPSIMSILTYSILTLTTRSRSSLKIKIQISNPKIIVFAFSE